MMARRKRRRKRVSWQLLLIQILRIAIVPLISYNPRAVRGSVFILAAIAAAPAAVTLLAIAKSGGYDVFSISTAVTGLTAVVGFGGLLKVVLVDRRSELPDAFRRVGATVSLALAVWIGGRARRWQAEDWRANLVLSPHPVRYSLDLLRAAVRMRLYDLGGLLMRIACWVLASDLRTWGLLGPILGTGFIDITLEQGWGSALFTIPGVVGIALGVEWLRHRWGVKRHPRKDTRDR